MLNTTSLYNSIQSGRNAIKNFRLYTESMQLKEPKLPDVGKLSEMSEDEFEKTMQDLDNEIKYFNENTPPVDFALQYSEKTPSGIDKMSLLGAAYEELGARTSVDTEELSEQLQEQFGSQVSADAIDLDENGEIDVAEFATTILAQDSLSTDDGDISPDKINGIITNDGQNLHLAYYAKQNYKVANETYKALYDHYNLDNAKNTFLSIMG